MIASFDQNPEKSGIPISASVPIRKATWVNGMKRRSPPIFRMSCSFARWWMTSPAARNRSALKKACVIRWNSANPYAPSPAPTNM